MKHWQETRAIVRRLGELAGTPAALATVIGVRGSAYRHEGARMLVEADGRSLGNVSGGCLELDVREVAARVLATGVAERRRYCSGSDPVDAWDLGVGCEGEVEVFVQRVTAPWADVAQRLAGELPFAIEVDLARGTHRITDAELDEAPCRAEGERFRDPFTPPPALLIFGAGDDAVPLARLALDVGFRVTVVDRRPGLLVPARFPSDARLEECWPGQLPERLPLARDAFAVVMTHHYADDAAWVEALHRTPLRYLGVLGPRQRTDRILAGIPGIDEGRIFGPVGLDIGTDGAEQVALAILAEIMAVRSGRPVASLRERLAPIHADG